MRASESNTTAAVACESLPQLPAPRRLRRRARIAAGALGLATGIVFFFSLVPPAHSGGGQPATPTGSHWVLDALRLLTRVAAGEPGAAAAPNAARALPSGGIRN